MCLAPGRSLIDGHWISTSTDLLLAGPCKKGEDLASSSILCSHRRDLASSMGSGVKSIWVWVPGPLLCLISLDSFLAFRFFIKWRIVYTVKMQVVDQRRATDCEMHASWGRCSLASYDVCMPMSTPAHHAWVCAKTLQLCLTLCDPMDCSSSVHGFSR